MRKWFYFLGNVAQSDPLMHFRRLSVVGFVSFHSLKINKKTGRAEKLLLFAKLPLTGNAVVFVVVVDNLSISLPECYDRNENKTKNAISQLQEKTRNRIDCFCMWFDENKIGISTMKRFLYKNLIPMTYECESFLELFQFAIARTHTHTNTCGDGMEKLHRHRGKWSIEYNEESNCTARRTLPFTWWVYCVCSYRRRQKRRRRRWRWWISGKRTHSNSLFELYYTRNFFLVHCVSLCTMCRRTYSYNNHCGHSTFRTE